MRLFIIALVIAATAMPASAESKRKRAKRCAAQAEIVGQAVEMRRENKEQTEVETALAATVTAKLSPTVPLLVGFVFSLSEADLEQDVQGPFKEQCNGFKP